MKRRLVGILPFAILVLALVFRASDPPLIERLQLRVFDEYQRLLPRPYEDLPIRVVDIDDESLARLGQWPWPRSLVAQLIARMGELGAGAIALDMVFAEPDRTAPQRLLPQWAELANTPQLADLAAKLPDPDAALATAVGQTPTVVGVVFTPGEPGRRPPTKWGLAEAGDDPRPFVLHYTGAVANLEEIDRSAPGLGSFNVEIEQDGIVRRVPVLASLADPAGRNVLYPSLVLEAFRVAQGASTYIVKASGASGETAFGLSTGINHVRVGEFTIPTDWRGRIWLYDTGPVAARTIPAWQILEPDFDPQRVDGHILFVGTSAAGLKDLRATPLASAVAGVEIHVQLAEQILLGRYLSRPDWMPGAEMIFLVVLGLALLVLLPRFGPMWCALLGFAGVCVAVGASWFAFDRLGWLADPLYPSAVGLALYLVQSMIIYLRTEGERRQVRQAFSRYMSPVLVDRLAREPDRLRLGGELREMTVMFCDIRNFTTISESLDAAELTRFINRFLTPMTDVILKSGGTIDKYMGDAIMAFWNAPLDDPDHARHGARAALGMVAELVNLNRQWAEAAAAEGRPFKPVAMGVGLNTGSCCVGNLGSEQRFDYSVVGDDVNLASRLEGQSKTYGVSILIGEGTQAALPDFAAIELDILRVKGKERPVHVYALWGDEQVAADPAFGRVKGKVAEMLAAYRRRDWDGAERAIAELRALEGERLAKFAEVYAERIAGLRLQPPPADWDAVFDATQK